MVNYSDPSVILYYLLTSRRDIYPKITSDISTDSGATLLRHFPQLFCSVIFFPSGTYHCNQLLIAYPVGEKKTEKKNKQQQFTVHNSF